MLFQFYLFFELFCKCQESEIVFGVLQSEENLSCYLMACLSKSDFFMKENLI